MDDREKTQLSTERDKGARAESAYRDFISPFIEQKEAILIEAFRACEIRDEEGLMKIKMQYAAIDSLETELKRFMETGRLADMTLNQIEAEKKASEPEINDE